MSKAKPIEQKKGRPIREIKMVGRDFFVEMQMGRACPVVVITPAEFNRMMDMMMESENMHVSILDKMAEICRRNFRKGKLARRLRPDTIEQIKAGYCEFFGREWESITAMSRKAAYIETRMFVCGHLHSMGYSEPEIAAFFIPRDRTTIMGALERFGGLMQVDKSFAFNAGLLASHMEEWMLDSYEPRTTQAAESLPEIQFESEGSIHTSTDKARIADESTKAADAIGKVIMEEWGIAPEPPKPIGDMALKDWIQ
jgi:hypothetical protein